MAVDPRRAGSCGVAGGGYCGLTFQPFAAELYQDPRIVLERAEQGDIVPVTTFTKRRTCLSCVHAQGGVRDLWCVLNNMPSAHSGRRSMWLG